jgi:hypothetical protein
LQAEPAGFAIAWKRRLAIVPSDCGIVYLSSGKATERNPSGNVAAGLRGLPAQSRE